MRTYKRDPILTHFPVNSHHHQLNLVSKNILKQVMLNRDALELKSKSNMGSSAAGQMQIILSNYLNQHLISFGKMVGSNSVSKYSIYRLANTGERQLPIAIPEICL